MIRPVDELADYFGIGNNHIILVRDIVNVHIAGIHVIYNTFMPGIYIHPVLIRKPFYASLMNKQGNRISIRQILA